MTLTLTLLKTKLAAWRALKQYKARDWHERASQTIELVVLEAEVKQLEAMIDDQEVVT
jgi:hypothetical protein